MKRKLAALLGGAAVVVTAGLSAAAPALASTSAPASHAVTHPAASPFTPKAAARYNPGDGWVLQLYTGQSELTNQGSGNQAQWVIGNSTTWNTTAATTGYKIMPNGNSSLCLEADGTTLNSEPCASGRNTQWWTFSGGNVCSGTSNIQNVGTSGYIGGFNPSETKPAWVESPHNGYYIGVRLCNGM